MILKLIIPLALNFTASRAAAAPPADVKPVRMQFAFVHFKNERVRVAVDGKPVFSQKVPAADVHWPRGLMAFAQITLPPCANIVVTAAHQRLARRLCRTAATKSIVIDGGPPLTLTAMDQYQGLD
jgi:hypothetical protein